MKEELIKAKRRSDGKLYRVFQDGREEEMKTEHSSANAPVPPDSEGLTDEQLSRMRRIPLSKTLRRQMGLTQEQFAERFGIPLGTLRDWEQGRSEPEASTRSYLRVIAKNPDMVRQALA